MLHQEINKLTGLVLQEHEDLHSVLTNYLEDLITNDFPKLVNLLYRIDVDEDKLKLLLKQHPSENAAAIMADMIIERQLAKMQARSEQIDPDEEDADERW